MTDDHETTQLYGANGKVFGEPRGEPAITGIWVWPRDIETGERLAVERVAADGLWRLVYETVLPERVHRVDAHQRKVHCEIMLSHAEIEWIAKLARANPGIAERRRLPVPPTLEVDDLLDLAARAASAWHAPAGQEVELTPAELHQLGEGAAMEIDRWQREAHEAVQEVRRLTKITRDLAAMSERCHRAELSAQDLQRDRRLLEARVAELESDLAATQQARVAEALDRASRTITGRPAVEVSAELTEQLSGDPEPIDGPERFRDDDTVVVDVSEL